MKVTIAILFMLVSMVSFGQTSNELYQFVDSIAQHELKFDNKNLNTERLFSGNFKEKGIIIRDATFSDNYPLIIINRTPIKPTSLYGSSVKGLQSITIIKPEEALILYGSNGRYGAIVLKAKKGLYRKLIKNQ